MLPHTRQPPPRAPLGICWGRCAAVAGIAAMALLAASCAAGPEETAQPGPTPVSPTTDPSPEPTGPPEVESPEPEPEETVAPRELRFTAPRLGGGEIRGVEYAGRDVAIWFWAPW